VRAVNGAGAGAVPRHLRSSNYSEVMALGLYSSTRRPPGITGCCSARLAGSRAPRGSRAPPSRAGCPVLPLTQRRNLPAGGGEWRVVLELICVSPEDPLPHSHRALLPSRPWRPPPAPVLALSRPYFAPTAFRPACRCRAPSAGRKPCSLPHFRSRLVISRRRRISTSEVVPWQKLGGATSPRGSGWPWRVENLDVLLGLMASVSGLGLAPPPPRATSLSTRR
jgi:hypothetical protein